MTIQALHTILTIFLIIGSCFGSVMATEQASSPESMKEQYSPAIMDFSSALPSEVPVTIYSDVAEESVSLVSLYAPCAIEKNTSIPVSTLITGSDGHPLPGIAVTITGSDNDPVYTSGITNENGQFSTDLILSGTTSGIILVAEVKQSATTVASDPVSVYFY